MTALLWPWAAALVLAVALHVGEQWAVRREARREWSRMLDLFGTHGRKP